LSSRTSLRLVVPRTIESSTITTRLPASTSVTGLNLTRTPKSRRGGGGRVEAGPPGGVGGRAGARGGARAPRAATRGRGRGVGHRDHDVRLGRMLGGELVADAAPDTVHRVAEHAAVGA